MGAQTNTSTMDKLNFDEIVVVNIPPEDQLKLTTACGCCMWSYFIEFPACCGANDDCGCLCCSGGQGCTCLVIDESTRALQSQVQGCRCIDLTQGDLAIYEAGSAGICCFCCKGAQKAYCGVKECNPIFRRSQALICDYRCALPPTDDTVPLGIACCGAKLCGNPGGSCRGK